ncbi:glutamate racemase [Lampropedia aestuarii]|uniref:Glutamate racemase n=1 Tax=Lampropedia aestuarii TaxID=2562762 RepID=A0A4S5BTK5_9BURK|nr:glutamate racemase [Lampropedia aestuarii]THJ34613.1 glutamate racemase [Lampropedia aestuarii]
MSTHSSLPIGVFDSGIGGLSILQALQQQLPHETFVYFSDSGFAPYGERSDAFITERSLYISEGLQSQHQIKALVVACNTATTVAIHALRARWQTMPIIGVEPAIKPALASTTSGHIAVLATARTLASPKYQNLVSQLQGSALVRHVACNGLAKAIEQQDTQAIEALSALYIAQALARTEQQPAVDTLVLGCTHYPLVLPLLQKHAPASVQWLDSASAVAKQTEAKLQALDLLAPPTQQGHTWLQTSGDSDLLHAIAKRCLPQRQTA